MWRWAQIWGGRTEDAEGSGVGAQERKRETEPLHQPGPRRKGGRGERGSLTLVLVRLALALARRVGLTASAIDPTALRSPFVFVKTLRFRQPAQFHPPDCHMIDSLPLPEKGRQLGASTGCSVGQTTPRNLFTGGYGPASFRSGPAPWHGQDGLLAPPRGVILGRDSDSPD